MNLKGQKKTAVEPIPVNRRVVFIVDVHGERNAGAMFVDLYQRGSFTNDEMVDVTFTLYMTARHEAGLEIPPEVAERLRKEAVDLQPIDKSKVN